MVVAKVSRFITAGSTIRNTKSETYRQLAQNGYIHGVGKGLFSLLPLGQRVLDRLCAIIDDELQAIGAQKVHLPLIGPKELWERTDRWNLMGSEMIRLRDRTDSELCLQPTAEEMCTHLVSQLPGMKKRKFPLMLYQTTEKFRDEMNPRFGLIRAREFIMKDLYSYDVDYESAVKTYNEICQCYETILHDRLGLNTIKVSADSGVHGGSLSHEYHLLNSLQEDGVYKCDACDHAFKVESEADSNGGGCSCPRCSATTSTKLSTIEIAHTFQLGTKYTKTFDCLFNGEPLEMCCFGIGATRMIPAVCESLSATSIRWPKAIAPFDAAVIVTKASSESNTLREVLSHLRGEDVLLDDRTEMSIGKRIRHLTQLGIPRLVVLGHSVADERAAQVELLNVESQQEEPVEVGRLAVNDLMHKW